jgi:hypothetical protein
LTKSFKKQLAIGIIILLLTISSISVVSAIEMPVVNSQDWKDVFSVMMVSVNAGNRVIFVNSSSFLIDFLD